ncbi:MAG: 50S ribosomal protein L9, partial [Lactococcus sp.]|nr:50S ribosomal protein L9 [Lactococcus sp.]
AMAALSGQVKAEEKAEAEILAEAKALQTELEKEATVVEIKEKVGADGRLFGAINSKKIADALNEQFDLKLDKHKIQLAYPLKAIGLKDVPVKLHKDVIATIRVKISEK